MQNEAELHRFIKESNAIEGERSQEAFEDSISAWNYVAKEILSFSAISVPAIQRLHSELMRRLNPRIAGNFRNVNVSVGGKGMVDHKDVLSRIDQWVHLYGKIPTFGNADTEAGKEVTGAHIKKAHIAFEAIHPFEDGNGRVGRMILNWHRVFNGLPILIIYEKYKQSYYDWFK